MLEAQGILVSARIHKEAIINLIICVDSRPLSVQLVPQQVPIRLQVKPHVPSTCEFAKSVKACCSNRFFLALCCLGKIPGGAPFSQLHKGGNGSRVDRP